ncbi:MAG: hypothetical protein HRT38_08660 [Alteromonadaceae bacterium]|nr:hypothetical protein [Alteromonadaceae bacterium]
MKKLFRTALAATIALTLVACHDSDKKDPDPVPEVIVPTTLDITGQAVIGKLAGALVEVFNVDDLTTPIGTAAQTDANGDYAVTITDDEGNPIVGAYVVHVSADEDSTMVCSAITCGDVVRGELIPAADLTGLVLSTFTYSDGTGTIEADVNALTTMATDAILSAAEANENIDLSVVSQDGVASLQLSASQVVGSLLGLELAETNIFDVNIVDASVSADVPADDAITATLTLINASFSGLDSDAVAGRTNPSYANRSAMAGLGSVMAQYFTTFKAVVGILVATDAEVSNVSTEQLAVITSTQSQISQLVSDLSTLIGNDTGTPPVVVEVETEVDLEEIIEIIGEIETGTGGTTP